MQVIRGQRGTGKTKLLIRYCLDNDITIVCFSKEEQDLMVKKSINYFNQIVKTVLSSELESFNKPIAVDDFNSLCLMLFRNTYKYNGEIKLVTETVEG